MPTQFTDKLNLIIEYQKDCIADKIQCNIIGERVAYFRKERDLNSVEFCKKAGISRSTLYKLENGKLTPGIHILEKIVTALDIDAHTFTMPMSGFENIDQYNWSLGTPNCNIYKLKDEIKKFINSNNYCYYLNGKKKVFPKKHFDLLINNIEASFAILTLVKHDKDQGENFRIDDDKKKRNDYGRFFKEQ